MQVLINLMAVSLSPLKSLFNFLDEHTPILICVTLFWLLANHGCENYQPKIRTNHTMRLVANASKLINIIAYNIAYFKFMS